MFQAQKQTSSKQSNCCKHSGIMKTDFSAFQISSHTYKVRFFVRESECFHCTELKLNAFLEALMVSEQVPMGIPIMSSTQTLSRPNLAPIAEPPELNQSVFSRSLSATVRLSGRPGDRQVPAPLFSSART